MTIIGTCMSNMKDFHKVHSDCVASWRTSVYQTDFAVDLDLMGALVAFPVLQSVLLLCIPPELVYVFPTFSIGSHIKYHVLA